MTFVRFRTVPTTNGKLAKQEMLLYIQPPSFVCILRDFAVKIFTCAQLVLLCLDMLKDLRPGFKIKIRSLFQMIDIYIYLQYCDDHENINTTD